MKPLFLGARFFLAILAVTGIANLLLQVPANTQSASYRLVENWPRLPANITLGGVVGADPDARGNIWAFHRGEPPILKLDAGGNLLESFGEGMFVQAHGLFLDRGGNIWVTDAQGKGEKGHQVFKFSPTGKILMTLGKAGVAGEGPDTFNAPTDVVVAPAGEVFVADGHGNSRVVKFSKDGQFLKAWGTKGAGPGQFNTPHTIALDSKGRVFVGDRGNNRIQIFDQDGKFLDQWAQFGRPGGMFISADDTLYVADSDSSPARNPGFKKGIRIGSARDGSVAAFIEDRDSASPDSSGAEGVSADARGSVYAAVNIGKRLEKYEKK